MMPVVTQYSRGADFSPPESMPCDTTRRLGIYLLITFLHDVFTTWGGLCPHWGDLFADFEIVPGQGKAASRFEMSGPCRDFGGLVHWQATPKRHSGDRLAEKADLACAVGDTRRQNSSVQINGCRCVWAVKSLMPRGGVALQPIEMTNLVLFIRSCRPSVTDGRFPMGRTQGASKRLCYDDKKRQHVKAAIPSPFPGEGIRPARGLDSRPRCSRDLMVMRVCYSRTEDGGFGHSRASASGKAVGFAWIAIHTLNIRMLAHVGADISLPDRFGNLINHE